MSMSTVEPTDPPPADAVEVLRDPHVGRLLWLLARARAEAQALDGSPGYWPDAIAAIELALLASYGYELHHALRLLGTAEADELIEAIEV